MGIGAVEAAEHSIHFNAEHLAEAAQETRYYTLPVTQLFGEGADNWAQLGHGQMRAGVLEATGWLVSFGHAWRGESGAQFNVFAFVDRFAVADSSGIAELNTNGMPDVPVSLPAEARFFDVSGRFDHAGVGAMWLSTTPIVDRWGEPRVTAGALVEYLNLHDYHMSYELTSGTDTGAAGTLGYTGANFFVTPVFGVQSRLDLSERWRVAPRALFGIPLPPGNFATHLSGVGFDVTPDATTGARAGQIGDTFGALSLSLRDRETGLEIDIGSTLFFPTFEHYTHPGVNRALLLTVSWHGRGLPFAAHGR